MTASSKGTLRDFLAAEYSNDPAGLSRFATNTCKLVRITRRWWRGYKVMDKAEVSVAGEQVKPDAVTQPRWKLIPKECKEEFVNFEKAVDQLIAAYCVFAREDADGRQPLLTGGGNYAVDAANWPRVRRLLELAQEKWGEAADRWCTDDGYERFHAFLAAEYGADYAKVKDLVPPASKLRRRFGLDVVVLPIRLAEDAGDPDVGAGLKTAVTELLDAAVRLPREEAAAAWRALADQLVDTDGEGNLTPRVNYKEVEGGKPVAVSRRVQGRAVTSARRTSDALDRCARYMDVETAQAASLAKAELPDDESAAKALAVKLNSDDAEALRVGKILITAATAAGDEALMCAGVAAAVRRNRPTSPARPTPP